PLASIPLKGEYMRRDLVRSARVLDIAYREPVRFPIVTLTPARAFYWADAQDPARARDLARGLYRAYFAEGIDISEMAAPFPACPGNGFNPDPAAAGIQARRPRTGCASKSTRRSRKACSA